MRLTAVIYVPTPSREHGTPCRETCGVLLVGRFVSRLELWRPTGGGAIDGPMMPIAGLIFTALDLRHLEIASAKQVFAAAIGAATWE